MILIFLAGRAAERRCVRGGGPGWKRVRSFEEIRAYHEAGHAVFAAVLRNDAVLHLDITNRVDLGRGGICVHGKPASGYTREQALAGCERRLPSDYKTAIPLCSLLAAGSGWRGTLHVVRVLCAAADRITDMYWWHIAALGAELARRGEVSQEEIESFLPRTMDAATSADKPALAACGATHAPGETGPSNGRHLMLSCAVWPSPSICCLVQFRAHRGLRASRIGGHIVCLYNVYVAG